jgi:energy-coupling factor transporter ATP-binding protein EcfA2
MDAQPKLATAYDVILEWSTDRPAWQRDALRRIVQEPSLTAEDIAELAVLCKQARQDATGEVALQAVHLDASHFPANPGAGQSVSLTAINNVSSVNKLAPNQTLSFRGTGITLIYGDNGAGKSGYGRLLKRVCRARHSEVILPDVYGLPAATKAGATLCYRVGNVDQVPEDWRDTGKPEPQPHPTLSAISVFDADCAEVHLKTKTDVAFRPFGLDVPDELVSTCKLVKTILDAEKALLDKTRNAILVSLPWSEASAVGKAIAALDHSTDLTVIEQLAVVNAAEKVRLARLTQDLAKDPATAAAEQKLKADRLKHLAKMLAAVEAGTSDKVVENLASLNAAAKTRRNAASLAANTLFGTAALPEVGGEVWRALWEAARRYSTESACVDEVFPPSSAGMPCMLCHQPLSDEAVTRLQTFESFVCDDTERLAIEAEGALATARSALLVLIIRFEPIRDALAELTLIDGSMARSVRRYLAAARRRRHLLTRHLDGVLEWAAPANVPSPLSDLAAMEGDLRAYAQELQEMSSGGTRKALESERDELAARVALATHIAAVRAEVTRLAAIKLLEDALLDTNTAAVTNLGNRIADQVLTPHLRDRFSAEIIGLVGAHVRVEMVRSGGQFGSPQYQIRLLAMPSAKVASILSEGEQTCVALAAFLAELATAPHNSALIFDDPITSLDHKWRQKVAKRLVAESEVRQVIVFTHDLVFANDIRDAADPAQFEARHISRSATVVGMVNDHLPWIAMSILSRVDDLEKRARALLIVRNDEDEDTYKDAVGGFYSKLREAWERALEEVAFAGVVLRHRDYIDAKWLARATAFAEKDSHVWAAAFKKCSGLLIGHDPSQGRNRAAPEPEELLQDVAELGTWVRDLKSRQAKVG